MPLSATRLDHVDGVLPLDRIATSLVALASGDEVYEVSSGEVCDVFPQQERNTRNS